MEMFRLSFMIAVVAYIYSDVLTEGGMIFNNLFNWLDKKLPSWLFKPLIGCYKCVAGQMALWVYTYVNKDNYIVSICSLNSTDKIIILVANHIYFICLTILIVWIINKVYRKEI